MIIDFRVKQNVKQPVEQNVKHPVVIDNSNVEIVNNYKYLGCTIQDNLKWNEHVDNQINKSAVIGQKEEE